jgi:type IV pilus assembly protein PilA
MPRSTIRKLSRDCPFAHSGFSLIELLIVVAIILIIAGIAIPNLLRSRMAANQVAAVADLRTMATAATSYSAIYGNGYPPTLASMGGPAGSPPDCNQAGLLDPLISTAPNIKSGYQFTYTGQGGNVTNTPAGCTPGFFAYLSTAAPTSLGITGEFSYCSDEPAAIHYDSTGNVASSTAACEALPILQ